MAHAINSNTNLLSIDITRTHTQMRRAQEERKRVGKKWGEKESKKKNRKKRKKKENKRKFKKERNQ